MPTVSSMLDIFRAIFVQWDVSNALSISRLLSLSQFNSVYNVLLLAIAAIFALTLVLLNVQAPTCQRYRLALLVSTVVISVAGYQYFRIFNSWDAVYSLQNEVYALTSEPFNDAYRYRYTDWLLTVPLLLVESVAVLALPVKEARPLLIKLAAASVAIIAMGYPSEISHSIAVRIIWGTVSTIPFAYILSKYRTKIEGIVESHPD
jgi:bacteriorhodopsin